MSHLTVFETICTFCEHPNEAEVWSAINVKTDPELKDVLLGGELNMSECAACHKIFYAEHFLLYHDPDFELMAFVYPHSYSAEKEKWELKTQADFAQTQVGASPETKLPYEPVTLFGLDELVALAVAEEDHSIQAEIVRILSEQHNYKLRRYRPSEARSRNLPWALPYIENGHGYSREAVLAGLSQLKTVNDRLTVYNEFAARLEKDASIDLGAAK